MTEEREAELLLQVPTLATLDEAQVFRDILRDDGPMGSQLYGALVARMDYLAAKEGRR